MKKFLGAIFFLSIFLTPIISDAYVSVKGHYKSNGTYVAPYVRSNPNGLKYDNYSYTSSQDLYNKTYGTRGAEWDTPTYITDPDYYAGKAIYDANQGSSYSNSYSSDYLNYSNTYSVGSNSATYTQSINSPYTNSYYSGTTYSVGGSNSTVKKSTSIESAIICPSDEIKYLGRCMNKSTYCRSVNGDGYFYDQSLGSCASCPTGYKYDGNGQCKTPELLNSESNSEANKQAQERLKRKGRI